MIGSGAQRLRVTREPVLRRFWYPVMRMPAAADGPRPFTLLGEDIVIWLDAHGRPCAVKDRCCHRTAKLSRGFVEGDLVVCGYHGWAYDRDGKCRRIPQHPQIAPDFGIPAFRCEERYGYVWVCLGEPLGGIPDVPEAADPAFRCIHEFDEEWACGAFRVMENSFDNAHFSYVHRASFGDYGNPDPSVFSFTEYDWGFEAHSMVPVINPDLQKKNLKIEGDRTVRDNLRTWWMPFARKLRIKYPTGLQHIIVTAATPIDENRSKIIQFAYRNDSEAESPVKDIIAFDRQVTDEDRFILEATEYAAALDPAAGGESHMASDQPGMIMRRKLKALIAQHA